MMYGIEVPEDVGFRIMTILEGRIEVTRLEVRNENDDGSVWTWRLFGCHPLLERRLQDSGALGSRFILLSHPNGTAV